MTPKEYFEKVYKEQVMPGIDRLVMGALHANYTMVPSTAIDKTTTVNINIPVDDFDNICKKIKDLDDETIIRNSHPEIYELWLRYKMMVELYR